MVDLTNDEAWAAACVKQMESEHGVKPADVVRVAGLIGDQRSGLMSPSEMLAKIRAYYEADIRDQVAREIEAVAASVVHACDEPVFVDAAYVARHGFLSLTDPTKEGDDPLARVETPGDVPAGPRTWAATLPCPACGQDSVFGYRLDNEDGEHMHTRYVCAFWRRGATLRCGWSGWSVPGWDKES